MAVAFVQLAKEMVSPTQVYVRFVRVQAYAPSVRGREKRINKATAPGKVILFGEHAVVYGRPAMAVPVLEVQAKAVLHSRRGDGFRIVAANLERDYRLADAPPNNPLAKIICLTYQYLKQPLPSNLELRLTSTIPLGRGLGSGAAVSTAIVRALAMFYDHPLSAEEVSALVYEVEKIHHGTPSGIDNTVIAFEQPVYFVKGKPIQRMHVSSPFTLVIGDTGMVSPTHRVVGDLRSRWQADPQQYEGYFDEISAITQQARIIIEQPDSDLARLGKLMNENHEVLVRLGISSPKLEQLIQAAHQAGALGAKLSGAGWGGNMIALATPQTAKAIAKALTQAGAVGVIVTKVK